MVSNLDPCCPEGDGPTQQDGVQIAGNCFGTSGYTCASLHFRASFVCSNDQSPTPYACTESYLDVCEGVEICDDDGENDEDNDAYSNCQDSDCSDTRHCRAICDKDGDGFKNYFCFGDDCEDDPEENPKARDIHPGAPENTQALCDPADPDDNDCDLKKNCADSDCQQILNGQFCNCGQEVCDDTGGPNNAGLDEDCDGFQNCIDSDCNTHPYCAIGGGGGDFTPVIYCDGQYLVTQYYRCVENVCTFMYSTVELIGYECQAVRDEMK